MNELPIAYLKSDVIVSGDCSDCEVYLSLSFFLSDPQNPTVGTDTIMRNTVGHRPFKRSLYPSQFQREQSQGKLHVTSKGKA